jgi:hypothetical protein
MPLFIFCILGGLGSGTSRVPGPVDEGADAVGAQHVVLVQLGKEHVARTVLRRGAGGDRIVAWGERILEWPLAKPDLLEVVPARSGLEYSNGGCALDVDGDGVEEIVVARGRGRARFDCELLWFREAHDRTTWDEHSVARLGEKSTDPHDIQPLSVRGPDGEVH